MYNEIHFLDHLQFKEKRSKVYSGIRVRIKLRIFTFENRSISKHLWSPEVYLHVPKYEEGERESVFGK